MNFVFLFTPWLLSLHDLEFQSLEGKKGPRINRHNFKQMFKDLEIRGDELDRLANAAEHVLGSDDSPFDIGKIKDAIRSYYSDNKPLASDLIDVFDRKINEMVERELLLTT